MYLQAAKVGKEYEVRGGDYENEPASKDKAEKGPPENKSEATKKVEISAKQDGDGEKPKANEGKKQRGRPKADSSASRPAKAKKEPRKGERTSARQKGEKAETSGLEKAGNKRKRIGGEQSAAKKK